MSGLLTHNAVEPSKISNANLYHALGSWLLKKRKKIIPDRQDISRWKGAGDPYIVNSIPTVLVYNLGNTIPSRDIDIFELHDNGFRTNYKGRYSISASYYISLLSPAVTQMNICSLFLYKNGTEYSLLDSKPMKIMIPTLQNYYFPFMTLHGCDTIELDEDDYFDIRFRHDSAYDLDYGTCYDSAYYMSIKLESKYT